MYKLHYIALRQHTALRSRTSGGRPASLPDALLQKAAAGKGQRPAALTAHGRIQ